MLSRIRLSIPVLTTSLCLGISTLLSGCSNLSITATPVAVSGNWQISSTAASATRLSALSGEFTGSSSQMTGILHSDSTSACVPPGSSFDIAGSTDAQGTTTLTATNVAGGTLTISGQLAANGKSFTSATYNLAGGSCGFTVPAKAIVQSFTPITGNYAGSFSDPNGQVISVAAVLTQSPAYDPNGNFTLSGTGTFPSNPCFISPVTVSNTQVTGGNFSFTYADPSTQNSVTAVGTFSTDGTLLTVTNWTLTGPCGPDSGTGLLTRQ